ncbi:PaaI family thioesterase [Leucobacter denitrificans]|uniref:PaaI family thioesterase n=1 Tax=Leucobacter denitrificans TaxID=683042 RepID=A0A7G9S534_9MICO|nr:PaaI family thioesterase [Leucobacter denitrificans]QNN62959.1 PaaI family thioesterase [Leucobacter denitrificans]
MQQRGIVGSEAVDLDGSIRAGALGVFADTVFAGPVMQNRPSPTFGIVTSELSMNFPTTMPSFGELISMRQDTVEVTRVGGNVTGVILGEGNRVLSTVHIALRFIDHGREYEPLGLPKMDAPGFSLATLLGVPEAQEGEAFLRKKVAPHLANPSGMLHGGIAVTILEYVASRAVHEETSAWECESLRVNYLRPAPLGEEVKVTARRVHTGRNLCVADAKIALPNGKVTNIARLSYRKVQE